MSDSDKQTIDQIRQTLLDRLKDGQTVTSVLRSIELRSLFDQLKVIPADQRADFGKQINELKKELESHSSESSEDSGLAPIDVTAPFDINQIASDELLPTELGSVHPITTEMERILDIGYRMGFKVVETPEIDDDYHMFGSLNFPEGHPARDDFDSFLTTQKEKSGRPYVAPAHTSTMQIRVLKEDRDKLLKGEPIAYFIPGRVFRMKIWILDTNILSIS